MPTADSYDFSVRWILLTVFLSVVVALPLRAGLYDPLQPTIELAESKVLTSLPHELFRNKLDDVRIAGDPARPKNVPRDKAIGLRDQLLKKLDPSPAERIQLGLVRLRLREYEAAMNDLQQSYSANPRDFWTLSVLGTAYLQMGQIVDAVRYLEAARDMFPETWPGSPGVGDVAKNLENTLLKLARLRMREQAGRESRRPLPPETVDDIFGVQFVGPAGTFEAGNLAPDQKAKLPSDAIGLVQQLLLWLPDDTRLYWLLGDLYAVAGDLDAALDVYNECLDARRFDAPLLRQHRQAVREAIAARPPPPGDNEWMPTLRQWLFVAAVAVPIIGLLINWQLRHLFRRRKGSHANTPSTPGR